MGMSTPETLHDSVDIAAPPERVWSLVTDLARMAPWSPQVVKSFVSRGPVQLGTRAFNVNRKGLLVWPTRSKVVVFEPHREFAFRVKDNATIWAFVLEPATRRRCRRHPAGAGASRPRRHHPPLHPAPGRRARWRRVLHRRAARRHAPDARADQGRGRGLTAPVPDPTPAVVLLLVRVSTRGTGHSTAEDGSQRRERAGQQRPAPAASRGCHVDRLDAGCGATHVDGGPGQQGDKTRMSDDLRWGRRSDLRDASSDQEGSPRRSHGPLDVRFTAT